ncbi:MAG: B12-binding domain-containing radical SAM protein, partial [Eubacterium sp.]|nr:B12-binding domain-containing radical SAM protein [Eubacterium sp.]
MTDSVSSKTYELALPDDILMQIEKPARYTGGELNMVKKELSEVAVRFCMCFPDVYEIGMSHLGIQILYEMFNSWDDTYCERVYCLWPDLDKIMREKHIPLFSLETQSDIHDFDFLGITLQYEMCYTNILQVLDLSGIPFLSIERTDDDPIVVAGGPCTYNPEPVADFFDIVYIGEGEVSFRKLLDVYKEVKANGGSRRMFLYKAASVPGVYVPSLYDIEYNADGTIQKMEPVISNRLYAELC